MNDPINTPPTAEEKESQTFREAVVEMFAQARRDTPAPWGRDAKFPDK